MKPRFRYLDRISGFTGLGLCYGAAIAGTLPACGPSIYQMLEKDNDHASQHIH